MTPDQQQALQDHIRAIAKILYEETTPLASIVTCLGDGHDGIWNLIAQIAPDGERREIQGLVSSDRKLTQGGWLIEAFEAG